MKNTNEFEGFSKRLRQSLKHKQLPTDAAHLATAFNMRSPDTPVSVEDTALWLDGGAIPTQIRILVLAAWLGVADTWLRFGIDTGNETRIRAYGAEDLLRAYRKLSNIHRQAISEIITALIPTPPEEAQNANGADS